MERNKIYHIYNRGNNKQKIYFSRENYLFFLGKIRNHIRPFVDILSYCLMPNHFHILISTNNDFVNEKFSKSYRVMLSSYTRAINKQEDRVGSLFQQNSKFKLIVNNPEICFHYIHQNPLKSKLSAKLEDWEFSSFADYIGIRNGTLCAKEVAYMLLNVSEEKEMFYKDSYLVINDALIGQIE